MSVPIGPGPLPHDAVPALIKLVGKELAHNLWQANWWCGVAVGAVATAIVFLILIVGVLTLLVLALILRGPR